MESGRVFRTRTVFETPPLSAALKRLFSDRSIVFMKKEPRTVFYFAAPFEESAA